LQQGGENQKKGTIGVKLLMAVNGFAWDRVFVVGSGTDVINTGQYLPSTD
jgi:hypothetical protein